MDDEKQERIIFPVEVVCPVCGKAQDLEPTSEDNLTTELVGCIECEQLFAVAYEFTVTTKVYLLKAAPRKRIGR